MVFSEQKGRNLLAYVDDIVVKSDKKHTHIVDSEKKWPQSQLEQVLFWHSERKATRLFSLR